VKEDSGRFGFSVSPNLLKLVAKEDLRFVNDTFRDLPRRAKLYPHLLFEQISSLRVGPLVTHAVGLCGVNDQEIMAACAHFIDIMEFQLPVGEEVEMPRPHADVMQPAASTAASYRPREFGRSRQRNLPLNIQPMFEGPGVHRSAQADRVSNHLRTVHHQQSGD
jgi:hypothetical protein